MFYLEYKMTKSPVKSIAARDRFDCSPFTTMADNINEVRKFSRRSDAVRCKNYWEDNLAIRMLNPWDKKIELYDVKEM